MCQCSDAACADRVAPFVTSWGRSMARYLDWSRAEVMKPIAELSQCLTRWSSERNAAASSTPP
jgi:hypothetical protein